MALSSAFVLSNSLRLRRFDRGRSERAAPAGGLRPLRPPAAVAAGTAEARTE
jgi:hypothetical protein